MNLSFRLVNPDHPNAHVHVNELLLAEGTSIPEELHGFALPGTRNYQKEWPWYVVAFLDGKPVGFIELNKRRQNHRPVFVTWATFVLPGYRRQGIAKALTAFLIRYASTRRIRIIDRTVQSPEMQAMNDSLLRDARSGKRVHGRFVPEYRSFVHANNDIRIRISDRKRKGLRKKPLH